MESGVKRVSKLIRSIDEVRNEPKAEEGGISWQSWQFWLESQKMEFSVANLDLALKCTIY